MKIPARPVALLLLLPVLLAGCLEIDTLVSVRADGSGTVTERVAFSGELAAMMREMEAAADGSGAGALDREELEARAARMGPGVRLESAEPLTEAEGLGYVAVWSFEDVNSLRVVQDAESAVPGEEAAGEEDSAPSATFRFEPGPTPVLHVQSSLAEADAGTAPAAPSAGEEAQVPPEMLKEMFSGLRFSLAVEVQGGIVETNASHVEGSRVTLLRLDFDELLENEAALQALAASDSPDPMTMQAALRGLPGLQVETAGDLRIAFAGAPATATGMADAVPAAAEAAPAAAAAGATLAPSAPSVEVATSRPAPMPTPAASLPGGSIGGYAWNVIAVDELTARVGDLVAVLDADGALTKGMVLGVEGGRVRLRRASMDGGGTVELPLDQLREASVFEREG